MNNEQPATDTQNTTFATPAPLPKLPNLTAIAEDVRALTSLKSAAVITASEQKNAHSLYRVAALLYLATLNSAVAQVREAYAAVSPAPSAALGADPAIPPEMGPTAEGNDAE